MMLLSWPSCCRLASLSPHLCYFYPSRHIRLVVDIPLTFHTLNNNNPIFNAARMAPQRSLLFLVALAAGLMLAAFTTVDASDIHTDGYCVMRDNCGSKRTFGKQLPCPYNGPAVEVKLLSTAFKTWRNNNLSLLFLPYGQYFAPPMAQHRTMFVYRPPISTSPLHCAYKHATAQPLCI
jgi:hypothetical protein